MNSGKSAAIRAKAGKLTTVIDPTKEWDAPIGKYTETKWLLYYGKGNSFWGVTAWCDRFAGASIYDTQREAEAELFLICAEYPAEFVGELSVVPTVEKYRDDKVLSEIAMREALEAEQKRKEDAAFQRWYDTETKRLAPYLKGTK